MSERKPMIESAADVPPWLGFVMGAADAALSGARSPRLYWVGRSLRQLRPVVDALCQLALRHPDEFAALLGVAVEMERMPDDD